MDKPPFADTFHGQVAIGLVIAFICFVAAGVWTSFPSTKTGEQSPNGGLTQKEPTKPFENRHQPRAEEQVRQTPSRVEPNTSPTTQAPSNPSSAPASTHETSTPEQVRPTPPQVEPNTPITMRLPPNSGSIREAHGRDFGSAFDSFVENPKPTGTVVASEQGLVMTKVEPGNGYLGFHSKCGVSGDFDVQVGYDLVNWPLHNFHTVRFAAANLPSGNYGMVGIYRNGYDNEDYEFRSQSPIMQVPTSDRSGTLRLTRTDSTIHAYYASGTASSFVLIGSAPSTNSSTLFLIDFATPSPLAPANVSIAFDNFKVNAGTLSCPR